MKVSFNLFLLSSLSSVVSSCPFRKTSSDIPDDNKHRHLRRRMASLREGETKDKLKSIIKEQQLKTEKRRRFLQTSCMTNDDYNDIRINIAQFAEAINDTGDRAHFFGGIVRLAAHDFMDFDQNQEGDAKLGSDGCLDFSNDANSGLPDIWCPNHDDCPLTGLYDTSYASFMSRADFWVAAANAVVQETSVNNSLRLPFRYGRSDRDVCPDSSERLPEASGCTEVEDTFITRMGVSWTDAVALMGAHTLGRGDEAFSGHAGTWVQSEDEALIFDKGFYEEAVRRAWRPRTNNNNIETDWTWGGRDRGTMMLNTDICLRFDIPDGNNQNCCTNASNGDRCRVRGEELPACDSSAGVRPEAFSAFEAFRTGRGNDNTAFYAAFSDAWQKATENGYEDESLRELADTCEATDEPTTSPTPSPTDESTAAPTPESTASPTPSPTEEGECKDVEGPVTDKGGGRRKKDCTWVKRKRKCRKFGHLCPVSCGLCTP